MPSPPDDVRKARDQLKSWLLRDAYPLWAGTGRDTAHGGFFEKIDPSGAPVEAPRRARVVSRQVYAYAKAAELGWTGPWREMVDEGLRILLERYRRPDGLFRVLVDADGAVLDDTPEPYEQAFAMLALSCAHRLDPGGGYEALAVRTREALRARFGRPDGGFYDVSPHAAPLKANPHMHLFEAALAWAEVGADPGWRAMADAIGRLATQRMIDPATGALCELYDEDWRPLPGADVEPGHQFEWGWLLLRFGGRDAALRLIDLGEARGVDAARGVAINALGLDLAPRDPSARLWPQTERIRAGVAAALATGDDRYWRLALQGIEGLQAYLDVEVPGAWRDRMATDGSLVFEAAPASSFYHIIGAVLELDRAVPR
jgi:mannose/cellobiose epimerase-like protein (N-acyl-D-glucosamine 2-epimerase family)